MCSTQMIAMTLRHSRTGEPNLLASEQNPEMVWYLDADLDTYGVDDVTPDVTSTPI